VTPIKLYKPSRTTAGVLASDAVFKEMWEILLRGDPVYLEYDCPAGWPDAMRNGTIGKVTFDPKENASAFISYNYSITSTWEDQVDQFVEDFHLGKYTLADLIKHRAHGSWGPPNFVVKFDDRRNALKPNWTHLLWLKDYKGPTIWKNATPLKKKQPPKKVYDRLGREINVGDFANYILYHYTVTGAGSYFGAITKITDSGKVFAKNIKLGSKDRSEDKQIKDPSQITIMTKDLMDQLVLAKLRM
jgi:hypothetical protein